MKKQKQITLRCYAERRGNVWQAACIDLCLAAEADDYDSVIKHLHEQIDSHIRYALAHKKFTKQLMNRKAPLSFFVKYYSIKFKCIASRIFHFTQAAPKGKTFNESMLYQLA